MCRSVCVPIEYQYPILSISTEEAPQYNTSKDLYLKENLHKNLITKHHSKYHKGEQKKFKKMITTVTITNIVS